MSKLWMFLWAVTDHWVVLVTGGGVTACLMVLQYWLQKPFSWRIYQWVIVGFIASACFLAWRDEYDRAQSLLATKADLEGQLRELRSNRGSEEQIRALEAELRSSQQALASLQHALKARRLSAEERRRCTEVLAAHYGRQSGDIYVSALPSCHECMTYVSDFVGAINSVPGWAAQGYSNVLINVDFSGIGIGIKDPQSPPPAVPVFMDALKAAELPFTLETLNFLSPDALMLVIGNKP